MDSRFKVFLVSISIGLFLISCGQKEENQDLLEHSVGITVPLVTQQSVTTNGQPVTVFKANGFSSSYSSTPISFDQIKSIKLVLIDPKDGTQRVIAQSALTQKSGQQPMPIQGQLSIQPNDVVFLSDIDNGSLLPASIAFLQNPQIYVTIDLLNSQAFKTLYYTSYQAMSPQPTEVKLFLSFGK